jgi:hypothetical protein
MYPLCLILNKAMAEGTYPEVWKFSIISPIHKKGPNDNIANYRPIAKLSCMSKLFESIITDKIFNTICSISAWTTTHKWMFFTLTSRKHSIKQ